MKINGIWHHSITVDSDESIRIIDQRQLPHQLVFVDLRTIEEVVTAIQEMWLRGAPLIGAVAVWGLCFALQDNPDNTTLETACQKLLATRPTAVNLAWALNRMKQKLLPLPISQRYQSALAEAKAICEEDIKINEFIGQYGLKLIEEIYQQKQSTVNILTHCNAGWLATLDWGTALAPIYMAYDVGIPVHVWVDETRPRNQGAALTAWELAQHGVPFTLIVDNAGGHLMQHGMVDICLVGADRVTSQGDVCNKIGTYLKALAANDNNVPFYVAVPTPTIDWSIKNGITEIPIEQRNTEEVTHVFGLTDQGKLGKVCITLPQVQSANYGFDVTPARLVTGIITEQGIFHKMTDLYQYCSVKENGG
ncbi:S-methyl-5-thioribose-1-phosphate isomerase [Nostoc commune]|uniref:S-methyl-5-thioribose-1-phosphate isomerase n=1 Tax=Nostoc commune TaxID=1178 RepID=UPI0018C51771|nr:S-methyl-5-thioribose-1-phosphate isomerase [Nostoc commune]MBG1260713.1 S-methyl-5-thioribose-1-phosphate isomerase [Nostoc commune BAE]